MDVEEEERDESRSSKAQNIRRRIDDENINGRIATNTSLEENKSDEKTVAVTTQESLDGIREKAMRIGSLDELGASSSAGSWSSSEGAENDRTMKANEIVRAIVGIINKEGDIVVASDSKSKLWKEKSLKRAMQNWDMK